MTTPRKGKIHMLSWQKSKQHRTQDISQSKIHSKMPLQKAKYLQSTDIDIKAIEGLAISSWGRAFS